MPLYLLVHKHIASYIHSYSFASIIRVVLLANIHYHKMYIYGSKSDIVIYVCNYLIMELSTLVSYVIMRPLYNE